MLKGRDDVLEIYLPLPQGNKLIGKIYKDTFYKEVSKGDHLYLLLDAWGLDYEAFQTIEKQCKNIRILDKDENIVYATTPERYRKLGVLQEHEGHRQQIFLAREFFAKGEPKK